MSKKKKGKKKQRTYGHFTVQSPHTNHAKGRDYPLINVWFHTTHKVLTKTGKIGKAVTCELEFWNGKKVECSAVCCPPDIFVFEYGAKLALERAINSGKIDISPETREQLWNGFFAILDPKGKSRERIRQGSSD